MTLPASSADITVEWLNEALGSAGLTGGGAVRSLEREVIGAGAGFVGELTRLRLTYDRPDAPGPRTLISKLPTSDEAFHTLAVLLNLYEREILFYEQIADDVGLRVPKRYFSAMDAPAGRYVLLLEDLAPARCGDQLASCSLEEAKLVLTEIAKLHAAWWNSPRLKEFEWLPDPQDPAFVQLLNGAYQQSWPSFVGEYQHWVPAKIFEIGERFGASFDFMVERLGEDPQTIIHTDFRLDNMFFDLPDGSPLAVIDWQLAQKGGPMIDVLYFLAGDLHPDVRRRHQQELLRTYHEALLQAGATGYDFEALYNDYRAAALVLLIFLVTNRQNLDIDSYDDRARALLYQIIDRYCAAILDLNAAEFLPY